MATKPRTPTPSYRPAQAEQETLSRITSATTRPKKALCLYACPCFLCFEPINNVADLNIAKAKLIVARRFVLVDALLPLLDQQ